MTTRTFLVFSAGLLLVTHGLVSLRRADTLRSERDRQSTAIAAQQRALRAMRGNLSRLELAARSFDLRGEAAMPPEGAAPGIDQDAAKRWLQKVKALQRLFAEHPEQSIPQLQLLTDRKWVEVADDAQLDTEDGRKRALAAARTAAKDAFSSDLMRALESYVKEHHGELPPRVDALLPLVQAQARENSERPMAEPDFAAMLMQYQLTATGNLSNAPAGVLVKDVGIIDEEFDHPVEIERSDDGDLQHLESQTIVVGDAHFEAAARGYAAAHRGNAPASPADLLPYLDSSVRHFIAQALNESPPTPESLAVFQREVAKFLATPPSTPVPAAPPN
jgi:hypothetical protein